MATRKKSAAQVAAQILRRQWSRQMAARLAEIDQVAAAYLRLLRRYRELSDAQRAAPRAFTLAKGGR